MLSILKFVRGAVATKDLVPVLTHFRIQDGTIQGGNGRMSIESPCPELVGIDVTVPAERFLRAVDACDGEPKLKTTPAGKLVVSRGKFRAVLPMGDNAAFPHNGKSNGKGVKSKATLLPALAKVRTFIGEDASRPWACGVLFSNGYLYATNNVVICRVPFDWTGGAINLPATAVDELLRIGEEPTGIRVDEQSITFEWGKRWLKAQLLDTAWPDVDRFFELHATQQVPTGLVDAVKQVLPFCPDPKFPVIRFGEHGVATTDGEMMAEMGGIALPCGNYRAEPLLMVLAVATHADFELYPAPVPWYGEGVEGVVVGVKL